MVEEENLRWILLLLFKTICQEGIDKVISDVPVSTPTTIQDSMPRVGMRKVTISDLRIRYQKELWMMVEYLQSKVQKRWKSSKVGNGKSIL